MRWLLRLAVVLETALLVLPPGMSMLDARIYYGAAEALAYLEGLGPAGRRGYFLHECVDLAFIATYTLLLRRLAVRWGAPPAIALGPAAGDLVETVGILLLLSVAPNSHALATIIGFGTLAKWAGFLVVAAIFLRVFVIRRRERRDASPGSASEGS